MIEFKLPEIGEGVVEGEIVRWLKAPGDSVAANEALVEVMTDKATIEIPSPIAARVIELRAEVGSICAIDETIAILEVGAAAPAPQRPAPSTTAAAPAAHKPASSPAPAATQAAVSPQRPAAPTTPPAPNGPVLATPAARALAREAGIDLGALPVDERGRITKSDVLRARDQAPAPAPAAPLPAPQKPAAAPAPARAPHAGTPADGDEIIPFRGMRRRIAEGMVKAYTSAVHYTYVEQVNVTRLVKLRDDAAGLASEQGVKLSYLPFIIKAVVHALRKYPIVNAELDEAGGRIIVKKRYSIGVATATAQGLMVPVIHGADRLSILDLGREIARVSDAARKGTATRDELSGSTFTITSLGAIGGVLATPILNFPEVGILGVHAIRKAPIVDERDNIVIGHLMNLSVSLDHRVVDGFEGASFLQEVRRYLEDPNLLLLAGI